MGLRAGRRTTTSHPAKSPSKVANELKRERHYTTRHLFNRKLSFKNGKTLPGVIPGVTIQLLRSVRSYIEIEISIFSPWGFVKITDNIRNESNREFRSATKKICKIFVTLTIEVAT